MPCMRRHLHPPSTCSKTHALPFVPSSSSLSSSLTLFQTRVIDLTNVNFVEINLRGGPQFVYHLAPILLTLSLSDLLSRHVNKCHANEKPLPSTGGLRKKGSVSASRATTSKQVCDQCVQSNSSCDGCNPCGQPSSLLFSIYITLLKIQLAKCLQRRYRCTFVKFHRQTAPLGPGHTTRTAGAADSSFSNPPSPNSIPVPSPARVSSSSRDPVFHHPSHQHQSDDEFILGPPPTVVPTMADTLYGATPYTFPPLYPTTNDISGDNTDYVVGKYRAHAELFGSTRSAAIPASSSSSSMVSPNLYDPRPPPSSWLGWDQQQQDPTTDPYHQQQDHHHQQHRHHPDLISNSAAPPPSLSPISSSMNGNHSSYLPSVRYA